MKSIQNEAYTTVEDHAAKPAFEGTNEQVHYSPVVVGAWVVVAILAIFVWVNAVLVWLISAVTVPGIIWFEEYCRQSSVQFTKSDRQQVKWQVAAVVLIVFIAFLRVRFWLYAGS